MRSIKTGDIGKERAFHMNPSDALFKIGIAFDPYSDFRNPTTHLRYRVGNDGWEKIGDPDSNEMVAGESKLIEGQIFAVEVDAEGSIDLQVAVFHLLKSVVRFEDFAG
jgi:hypothetical protein